MKEYVACAIYAVRTVSNPPPYNISNGLYDQYVVEVTGSCSQY